MGLIARFTGQDPKKQKMSREQLIGLIQSDAKFLDERDAITEYVRSLEAGKALDEKAVREGYQQFKAERDAKEVAATAQKPNEALGEDVRFKNYGLAPKSAADFAFLLHGFHYLKDEGVMAIILPHGVLFRGGAEERIRTKLLKDGHIDTVIGLPANLFYSTGIPVCILVLKKCKKPDDVLFINAAEHFERGKRQNQLTDEHIAKIVETYRDRKQEERYSRRVEMKEIAEHDYNLNISRYVSTAQAEEEIDLSATQAELESIESDIRTAKSTHNGFLKELGLPPLPASDSD
jgi:type I restriction enzyme M protein